MTKFTLKPLDVVVIDGLWYMPHHWLIRWRGLDPAVHCCTVISCGGTTAISPEFSGIKVRRLDYYKGRRVTVHRYKGEMDIASMLAWLEATVKSSRGYDFRQWLMGFVLGLTSRKQVDDSAHWTCAELPYWLFQENGSVTPTDEVLPMPRLFRFNPQFEIVFDGIWE